MVVLSSNRGRFLYPWYCTVRQSGCFIGILQIAGFKLNSTKPIAWIDIYSEEFRMCFTAFPLRRWILEIIYLTSKTARTWRISEVCILLVHCSNISSIFIHIYIQIVGYTKYPSMTRKFDRKIKSRGHGFDSEPQYFFVKRSSFETEVSHHRRR